VGPEVRLGTDSHNVLKKKQFVGTWFIPAKWNQAVSHHTVENKGWQNLIEISEEDAANYVHLVELELDGIDLARHDCLLCAAQNRKLMALDIKLEHVEAGNSL
jgi:hypothetical protein